MKSSIPRYPYLRPGYLFSLPERLVRALAAALGGLLFELSEVALPGWLRRSRLYQVLVYRLLRLTVELVGDVQDVMPPDEITVGELAVRKALGNVIEVASFLAVGWSPLWLLAAASDLSGGTRTYLKAFAAELQENGLLGDAAEVQSVDELLNVLESSSGTAADLVDMPPLKVADMQRTWQLFKQNAASLPNAAGLSRLYQHMQAVAQRENRPVEQVSALIAAGALRAGVKLGSTHIFDYYAAALEAINREGWWNYARRAARPYLIVGKSHFDPARVTYTERLWQRIGS